MFKALTPVVVLSSTVAHSCITKELTGVKLNQVERLSRI
jgi:hypothetical protein